MGLAGVEGRTHFDEVGKRCVYRCYHHFQSFTNRDRSISVELALLAAFADRLRMTLPGIRPPGHHLTSTVAPASVNFFLIVSASSLEMPSFTVLGAPSTRSFASFKPRLVTSRTALITLILFAPTSLRTTANSVFSSAGAAPAAAAPPPATITGA